MASSCHIDNAIVPGTTQELNQDSQKLHSDESPFGCVNTAQSHLCHVFRQIFSESVQMHGSCLHLKLIHDLEEAVHDSSQGSAWFSSQPLSTAATKRIFQLPILGISIFFFYQTIAIWIDPRSWLNPSPQMQNIETWDFDNTSVSFALQGLSNDKLLSSGFLLNRCISTASAGSLLLNGSSSSFQVSGRANGFFATIASEQQAHKVKLLIDIAGRNSSLYPSVTQIAEDFQLMSSGPQTLVVFADLRLDWRAWSRSVGISLVAAVGFLAVVVAGALGKTQSVKRIAMFTFAGNSAFYWLAGIGYALDGESARMIIVNEKAITWLDGIPPLSLLVGIIFFERHVVSLLVVYAVAHILNRILIQVLILEALPSSASGSVLPFLSKIFRPVTLLVLLLALALTFLRKRVMRRSRLLLSRDCTRYDEMWSALASSAEALESLTALKASADRLAGRCEQGCPARQYNHTHLASPQAGFFQLSVVPDLVDTRSPIDSLDQLFAGAKCVSPIFFDKVTEWAAASNGSFARPARCNSAGGTEQRGVEDYFVRLAPGVAAGPAEWAAFAKVKSVDRAVEKVVRTYCNDVSRLVDVCRQAIVFDDLAGLAACLDWIAADQEVRVCRVKNRMSPAYDPALSMGYRDVALNLRLSTPETRRLGCELHVCELQLLLRPFAVLRTEEGHRRYVRFRNIRGE